MIQITWNNYKIHLPQKLWSDFHAMAQRARAQFNAIVYAGGKLRWAEIDEL